LARSQYEPHGQVVSSAQVRYSHLWVLVLQCVSTAMPPSGMIPHPRSSVQLAGRQCWLPSSVAQVAPCGHSALVEQEGTQVLTFAPPSATPTPHAGATYSANTMSDFEFLSHTGGAGGSLTGADQLPSRTGAGPQPASPTARAQGNDARAKMRRARMIVRERAAGPPPPVSL